MQVNSPSFKGLRVNYQEVKDLPKGALEAVEKATPELEKMAKEVNVEIGSAKRLISSAYQPVAISTDQLEIMVKQKGFLKGIFGTRVQKKLSPNDFEPKKIVEVVKEAIASFKQKLADKN